MRIVLETVEETHNAPYVHYTLIQICRDNVEKLNCSLADCMTKTALCQVLDRLYAFVPGGWSPNFSFTCRICSELIFWNWREWGVPLFRLWWSRSKSADSDSDR